MCATHPQRHGNEPSRLTPPSWRPTSPNGSATSSAWSEELLYITVGLLLLAAATLILIGTISGFVNSIRTHQSAVNIGVVLLDRILLTLIVAELLHTLRYVVLRGEIVVEPFLFVRSDSRGQADSHCHS